MNRRELLRLGIASLVVGLLYTAPIFRDWNNWGLERSDWDQHLFFHGVPYVTLLEYGQFPLWNPYYCGGLPTLAHPLSRFLSPTFLLQLLFGVVHGIKLELLLHVILGLNGTYFLARHLGIYPFAALASALVFMLNGIYALHLTFGQTEFMTQAFLPWFVLFSLKGLERPVFLWLGGTALSLIFLGGGTYYFVIGALFLLIYFGIETIRHRSFTPLLCAATVCVLSIGLGATKVFPTVELMLQFPRQQEHYSGYSLHGLLYSLFSRGAGTLEWPSQEHGFWVGFSNASHENYMYIGWVAGGLFLLGMARKGRRHWPLLICLSVFLWLSLGDRAPVSLWYQLHKLPVYHSMRVAQRFNVVMMLCLALFAGMGVSFLISVVRRYTHKRMVATVGAFVLTAIIAVDLLSVNAPVFTHAFTTPVWRLNQPSTFRQIQGFSRFMYPALLLNLGTLNCKESLYGSVGVAKYPLAYDTPSYRGEVFLYGTGGSASVTEWTPNRLSISVHAAGDGYVVINQNYGRGWKVRQGNELKPMRCDALRCWDAPAGLLAIRVSAADRNLQLYYRPFSFVVGTFVNALFIGAAIFQFARRRPPRLFPCKRTHSPSLLQSPPP